jgi:hypothetical protein
MAKSKLPKLPAGPEGPGRFGAYYVKLKWDPEWDRPWRVADHPDVVVRFDDGGHRLVFWRGTSYIPCWVTDNGKWYTNEFVERRGHQSPNTRGCCEPMSDKQCRFSHVRIIESNEARAVIHWRYSPVDVRYQQPFIDPETNWGDWVDEYYTVYPDASCIRKVQVQTTRPDLWMEFHEAIVVNQPGTMPEDNIELDALTVSNMRGETKTYTWTENGAPPMREFWERWDANIMRVNLKSRTVPFSVVPPHKEYGLLITPYSGHAPTSHFKFWNHWPVSQVACDGKTAESPDRPSHSSLCHFDLAEHASAAWPVYEEGPKLKTKLMLTGMTDKDAGDLVPTAKAWLSAPALKIKESGVKNNGFDLAQKAYRLAVSGNTNLGSITATAAASVDAPLVNPAFVVSGWGERPVTVQVDGKNARAGRDYRFGFIYTLDATDLVIWLRKESIKPVDVVIKAG